MPSTLPAIPPLPLARALPSAPLPWCLWRCSVHTSHAPRSICWSPPSWTPRCVTFGAIFHLMLLALFGAYITWAKIDLLESSILDPKVHYLLCY